MNCHAVQRRYTSNRRCFEIHINIYFRSKAKKKTTNTPNRTRHLPTQPTHPTKTQKQDPGLGGMVQCLLCSGRIGVQIPRSHVNAVWAGWATCNCSDRVSSKTNHRHELWVQLGDSASKNKVESCWGTLMMSSLRLMDPHTYPSLQLKPFPSSPSWPLWSGTRTLSS